jgi:hypothetical protein
VTIISKAETAAALFLKHPSKFLSLLSSPLVAQPPSTILPLPVSSLTAGEFVNRITIPIPDGLIDISYRPAYDSAPKERPNTKKVREP